MGGVTGLWAGGTAPPFSPKLFLSSRSLITGHKGSHNSIINNNQYKIQRLLSRGHPWVLSYGPLFLCMDPFLVLTDLIGPQEIEFLVTVLWKIYLVYMVCLWHLNDFLPWIPQYRLRVRSLSFPHSHSPCSFPSTCPPFPLPLPPSELSYRHAELCRQGFRYCITI